MNFDEAFKLLMMHEGGFQADPDDRGNWTTGKIGQGELKGTKYGISAMAYPAEDIQNLTLERAAELYKRDYWGPAGCDAVPDCVKFDLFDMAVNSGPKAAAKVLQAAVQVNADGVIGPKTLMALGNFTAPQLIARFNGARLLTMTNMLGWERFGKGWARRLAHNLLRA